MNKERPGARPGSPLPEYHPTPQTPLTDDPQAPEQPELELDYAIPPNIVRMANGEVVDVGWIVPARGVPPGSPMPWTGRTVRGSRIGRFNTMTAAIAALRRKDRKERERSLRACR